MDVINGNADDKCQHPDKCTKSYFTYCPHCHLFVCITHLNEHYDAMKNDISGTLNEAENQQILYEQEIDKIKHQQKVLNHLYENEIKILADRHDIIRNICENLSKNGNCYSLTSEYEKDTQELEIIKQEQDQRTFTQSFVVQIDQLLQQQNQTIDISFKAELLLDANKPMIADTETIVDTTSEPYIIIEEEEEESGVEIILDCDAEESLIDNDNEQESTTSPLKSKLPIKLVYSSCPLTHDYAFGIPIHHNIPNVPCYFQAKSDYLTFSECLYHLKKSHHMKHKSARAIVETLLLNTDKTFDVTTIDLFSKWTIDQLLSQSISTFVAKCPLIEKNVYGLPLQHNTILCSSRPPVQLYQHLRLFHGFKSECARRLITALMQNEPSTKEIFKTNEIIFNNSPYRRRSRKKPRATTT